VKITCPVCDAKYSITDEKVQDRLAKIRCRKCGTTIVIDGKVDPPNVYAADTPSTAQASGDGEDATAGSAGEYTVDLGENDQRSMSLADLVQAFKNGQVTRETYVWAEGFADWKALGEVSELTQAINTPAAKPAAPTATLAAPAAGGAALPWDKKPAATIDVDEDERTQIATRGAASLGGAADLFGGFASAGSEEEVTTSAQHHEAPAPIAGPVTASTGARNESSVLFSLSALTAAAASKPSRPAPGPSSPSEDSGLIDLKALATAAQKSPANVPGLGVAAAPLGFSPLGGGSPLGGVSPVAMAMPSPFAGGADYGEGGKKSKTGLYILASVALVGIVVVALALILKPTTNTNPEAAAVATATEARVAEPPVATQEKAPEAAAAPPATGTAEEGSAAPEVKAPTTKASRSAGGSKKAAKPAAASSKPAAGAAEPAAAPPAKKKSACGCAPGDLMCAMQCASK